MRDMGEETERPKYYLVPTLRVVNRLRLVHHVITYVKKHPEVPPYSSSS